MCDQRNSTDSNRSDSGASSSLRLAARFPIEAGKKVAEGRLVPRMGGAIQTVNLLQSIGESPSREVLLRSAARFPLAAGKMSEKYRVFLFGLEIWFCAEA
jgi:hypothetical protein